MTNLEVLCAALRKICRPDAAQILEDRTRAEWMTLSTLNGDTVRHFSRQWSGQSPARLLRNFEWGSTPESLENRQTGYWSPISQKLVHWYDSQDGVNSRVSWHALAREHS
jgi:hypothetical protein